jgi:hypothetical protein
MKTPAGVVVVHVLDGQPVEDDVVRRRSGTPALLQGETLAPCIGAKVIGASSVPERSITTVSS